MVCLALSRESACNGGETPIFLSSTQISAQGCTVMLILHCSTGFASDTEGGELLWVVLIFFSVAASDFLLDCLVLAGTVELKAVLLFFLNVCLSSILFLWDNLTVRVSVVSPGLRICISCVPSGSVKEVNGGLTPYFLPPTQISPQGTMLSLSVAVSGAVGAAGVTSFFFV